MRTDGVELLRRRHAEASAADSVRVERSGSTHGDTTNLRHAGSTEAGYREVDSVASRRCDGVIREKYFAQNDYKMPSTNPTVVQPTETKVVTINGNEA